MNNYKFNLEPWQVMKWNFNLSVLMLSFLVNARHEARDTVFLEFFCRTSYIMKLIQKLWATRLRDVEEAEEGPDTCFYEVSVRSVLFNLLAEATVPTSVQLLAFQALLIPESCVM